MMRDLDFDVRILRMDEPLLLDKSGEDEADILVAYTSEDGARKEIFMERSSPLYLLYSVKDLFSTSSTSFWLSPGYYPFRFDVRIVAESNIIIEIHPPSFPLAEFNPGTEESQIHLHTLLETMSDTIQRTSQSGQEDGGVSAKVHSFYLKYLEKLLRGQILRPSLFASTLSLEVPSIAIHVSPETYIRAIEALADAFFEKVTYEGALEETHQYKVYREGISAYEEWRERLANTSRSP